MNNTITNKARLIVTTGLFLGVLGTSMIATTVSASATTKCDKVNIVYCGIDGSTEAANIASFKAVYNSNKSGHNASPTVNKDYTDIQSIYKWAGITATDVNAMTAANTAVGTLYKDGRIVVDGKTIATDSWVSARFTNGNGFVKIGDGVYARKTTTSFENATAKVLVYMPNGQMKFAVMLECGNAVKATVKTVTPPTTPEKPVTPQTPETPKTPETPVAPEAPVELPKTGPASIIGLVSGVTLAGAAAHRIVSSRRHS